METSGQDYNIYVPIINALGALGKDESLRNVRQRQILTLENHLRSVPEDPRARVLLAACYSGAGRREDATREANLALSLRPNDAIVLYNLACTFCNLEKKREALEAIRKAWNAGFKDSEWARRDPELAPLHGDPEFERLFPERPSDI